MLPVVYRRRLNVPSFEACICFHEQLPSWFKSLLNHKGLLSLGSARQKVDQKKSSQSKASVESFEEKAMATLPLWKKNLDENGGEPASLSPISSMLTFLVPRQFNLHVNRSITINLRVSLLC